MTIEKVIKSYQDIIDRYQEAMVNIMKNTQKLTTEEKVPAYLRGVRDVISIVREENKIIAKLFKTKIDEYKDLE